MTFISKRVVDGVLRTRSTDINYTDLWHTGGKPIDVHEERTKGLTGVDPRTPASRRTGSGNWKTGDREVHIHPHGCDCAVCVAQKQAYAQNVDLSEPLQRRHSHILAIALSTNPAKGSDVLKRFHRAKAHYAEMALKPELAIQCNFLSTTYEYAAAILWARMVRYARTRHETTYTRHRSDPGTIGRTAASEPYVCEHPGCNCPAAQRRTRGFRHCEVTGCNAVAMHGPRCNGHRR